MVDYAATWYIYAAGIGGFWKECTKKPGPKNVRSLPALETAPNYHARISDLLDEITELREKFRGCCLNEYAPFRLGVAPGKYDAGFQYWWGSPESIQEILRRFKDGATMPTLDAVAGERL